MESHSERRGGTKPRRQEKYRRPRSGPEWTLGAFDLKSVFGDSDQLLSAASPDCRPIRLSHVRRPPEISSRANAPTKSTSAAPSVVSSVGFGASANAKLAPTSAIARSPV